MPLTTNDALFEAWAEQIETIEQNLESLYGPPGITPTLPDITTEDGLLEVVADEAGKTAWNFAKLYNATTVVASDAHQVTVPDTALYCAELIKVGGKNERSEGTIKTAKVTKIDSSVGDSVLVPDEVQELTGYGWSAGETYNYIDFASSKFIQKIGVLTFDGTETWKVTGTGVFYTAITGDDSQIVNNTNIGNTAVMCAEYPFAGAYKSGGQDDQTVTIGYNNSESHKFNVAIKDSSYSLSTWVPHLASNPISLYYPIVTATETDISSYLTDKIIKVAPGGTLTFVNDEDMDVPSEVEYIAI